MKSTYHYTNVFLLHNTKILMMTVYQLLVYFILIISNDLSEVIINTSVTLSFAAFLELYLQTFDTFFLSRFILMSYFISHIFLQLMLLVLVEGFSLNAQKDCRSLFFKMPVNAVQYRATVGIFNNQKLHFFYKNTLHRNTEAQILPKN